MSHWYHVTPLFQLPSILEQGGLICGADVDDLGSPRRESSREFDDIPLAGLGGKRVADCVLLYQKRKPMNNLLENKICGNRKGSVWRSYPHLVLLFNSDECFSVVKRPITGASVNVGRSLRNNTVPTFGLYDDQTLMAEAGVQEILILAEDLPGRTLPLTALASIETFSESDQSLVRSVVRRTNHKAIPIEMSNAKQRVVNYTAGQSFSPGAEYLRLHKELFAALESGNALLSRRLVERLSNECFD